MWVAIPEPTRLHRHRRLSAEEVVVDAASEAHVEEISEAVDGLEGIKVISAVDRTFKIHESGKLETISRIPLRDADDLSMAYTRCGSSLYGDSRR